MIVEVDINPFVKKWADKSNSDLVSIVSEVAELCDLKQVYVQFLPSWSNVTASSDRTNGADIGVEPTLFDMNLESEIRRAKQMYFIGHELLHPIVKTDGAIKWFTHEVFNKPNILDTTDAGIEDSSIMLCEDVKIDAMLFDKSPKFVLGFAAKHIPSYILDGQTIARIGKSMVMGKIPEEEVRTLLIRVIRRAVLARYLKDKDDMSKKEGKERVLISRTYRDINNMLRQYHEELSVMFDAHKTALNNLHSELYNTAVSKRTNPQKVLNLLEEIASYAR